MEFELKDACADQGPFTLKDGTHVTHVFAYNWAQKRCKYYMPGVIARLNQTDFKLLAWNAEENITITEYGLNVRLVGSRNASTWGGTSHKMYIYVKAEP